MAIEISTRIMDHAHGQWAGMRPHWWTATDTVTGCSITWSDYNGLRSQHKCREAALAALQLLIDEIKAEPTDNL